MTRQNGVRAESKGSKIEVVSKEDNNPLPPIDQLERLNGFRPDLVDKVVDAAMEEAKRRREFNERQNEFFMRETRMNRWTVTIIVCICLAITLALGLDGKQLSAFGSCLIPLVMLLSRFIK